MKFGDGTIMMGYPGPEYKNPKRLGQATQSLYVNVDDVDKHFERAKKAGANKARHTNSEEILCITIPSFACSTSAERMRLVIRSRPGAQPR